MLEWSKVTSGMVLGDQEAPGRWVCRAGLHFLGWAPWPRAAQPWVQLDLSSLK